MSLLKALSTVSGMTLLSRITGLARESLKASFFGAGMAMDAFEAAFRLPNILRRLFAEGAFSQAFVPIFAEYKRQRGDEATKALASRVGTILLLSLLVITLAGVLAAPWLVYALASGFAQTPGKVDLTAQMIRIVFPYILFVSLVSLAGGILNVYKQFAIPAFTPVLLNLSIIGSAVFLSRYCDPPILALAWGVFIGGVAQLVLQIRPLAKIGMLPTVRFDWRDEGVRRVLRAMGPAVLGVSAAQISALINTQLAASLGNGRISWITYADRLMEFPTALLGVALGTVLLPSLAKHHADSNPTEFSSLLDWGMRLVFLLALPAAVALWVLALPLVSTLYQYGRFTVEDVVQTRAALLGYSVGLLGLVLVKVLAPGFYARQQLRTPVKIAFVTVLVAQTFAVILMVPIGHAGLTLSTSIGACLNAFLLFWFLKKRGFYVPAPGWVQFLSKLAIALFVLAVLLVSIAGPASFWLGAGLWEKVLRLAGVCAAGGVVYLGALWLLGFRLRDFSRSDASG
jgi:putative peptidoglycan lipid II flippase